MPVQCQCSASVVPVQCVCREEVRRGAEGWRGVRWCLVQVVERDVEQLLRVAAGNQLVLKPHRHEVKELRQETRCSGTQGVAGRSVRGGRVRGAESARAGAPPNVAATGVWGSKRRLCGRACLVHARLVEPHDGRVRQLVEDLPRRLHVVHVLPAKELGNKLRVVHGADHVLEHCEGAT